MMVLESLIRSTRVEEIVGDVIRFRTNRVALGGLTVVENTDGDEIKEFFRDRGWLGVGLGYNPSDIWRFSFRFVWQKSYTGVYDDYSVSDIFYQIKVRKYINVEKVKNLFED
jgi:hypothetical protein